MEGSTEPQNKEPTLAEVQAIAEAASKTALEAKTAAEAKPEVKKAVDDEAAKQNVNLSDEDAKKIADMLVTQLDAMGVFEEASNDNVPPTPAATAAEGSAPTAPAAPPSAPAPPADDSSPTRKTFSERFMGR